jgi:hypothetical protein
VEYIASLLTTIAEQLKLPPITKLALQPGVRAVYRLTIRYHDRRAIDSVATVIRTSGNGATLEMVFRGRFEQKPLRFPVTQADYEGITFGFQKVNFDKLGDQPNLKSYGEDLWMWERAAGTFHKSVVLAPSDAEGAYWQLVRLAWTHLPEGVRVVGSE